MTALRRKYNTADRWMVFHQGGLSPGWSFTRVVFHLGGLSPGWPFIRGSTYLVCTVLGTEESRYNEGFSFHLNIVFFFGQVFSTVVVFGLLLSSLGRCSPQWSCLDSCFLWAGVLHSGCVWTLVVFFGQVFSTVFMLGL